MTKQCSTAFKLKKHAQYFCLLTGVLSLLTQILTWFIYAGNAITLLTVWQESLFFLKLAITMVR